MQRPYKIDTAGLVHTGRDCPLFQGLHGDATAQGAVNAISEDGSVPCPQCVGDEDRLALMDAAIKSVSRGGVA